MVILGMAFFAACGDDDATGPTAQGGEVALELFKHKDIVYRSTGEGYDFATCAKVKITMEQALKDIGEISDLDGFPEMLGSTEYALWATPHRIYMDTGGRPNCLHLDFGEKATFELVTLDGKARYEIAVEHHKVGFDAKRNGTVSEFVMRYRLLSS